MLPEETKLVEKLIEQEREIAALAAEVARLRAFLEAAETCHWESDASKIVWLAIGAPD